MAVARAPRPAPSGSKWPSPAELREHVPVVALLGAIWALPSVTRIGATFGETSVDLWVFMEREDEGAEAAMSAAERAYLNVTSDAGFTLHAIPGDVVSPDALPPYETLIER